MNANEKIADLEQRLAKAEKTLFKLLDNYLDTVKLLKRATAALLVDPSNSAALALFNEETDEAELEEMLKKLNGRN